MRYFHFAARLKLHINPFTQRKHYVDLWERLREIAPKTLGSVLMPDHLHLLAETPRPEQVRLALGHQLGAFTQKYFPRQNIWETVTDPRSIPDLHHLKRQTRYVHLNPCRRGLTDDPLLWEWSTHREAVGAAASDWLDQRTLMQAFKTGPDGFKETFHRYVSSDPSVHVSGTRLPTAVSASKLITTHEALLKAVLQASRGHADTPAARRQAIFLGKLMGVQNNETLAQAASLTTRRVRQILSLPPAKADAAVIQAATVLLSAPGRFGLLE